MSAQKLTNREVAEILAGVAARLQILDANKFRVIAFQNAAESVRNLAQDLHALDAEGALQSIPGVGKAIADALHELLDDRHLRRLRAAPHRGSRRRRPDDEGPRHGT